LLALTIRILYFVTMYNVFIHIESLAPIAFALIVGLAHAFEPDHLFMMSAIVTRRDNTMLALKDGLYWGMGHTVMLVFVGSVIIISRVTIFSSDIIEVFIGGMLVLFGTARLFKREEPINFKTRHGLPFVVGLIHGLAGSGALVLLVMSQIDDVLLGITYMVIFGIGSIIGMCASTGLLSIPFTPRMRISRVIRSVATVISAVLCISYGAYMVYQHI